MASATHVKTVDVCGDILPVRWDGNVWVSPHNGQQRSQAEQIDGYLSQTEDAE